MAERAQPRLIALHPQPPAPELASRWAAVVSHTHCLRVRGVNPEQTLQQLLAWCRRHRVAAVGLGSPWEPVSGANYGRYETVDRDLYYSGRLKPQDLLDADSIGALFARLNRDAAGATLFYQDNETPKSRYGHLWYFGFHYDVPAWHDYSQDRPVQYWRHDPHVELNAITGKPHRRRSYFEVIAQQRAAGALAIWAHPTSWWRDSKGAFVTNIAVAPLHLLADGFLDGITVMGYDPCHRWYQKFWFHLLDTGARVPGFAETDACFDEANLLSRPAPLVSLFPLRQPFTAQDLTARARDGSALATSGAFLNLTVDDATPGQAVVTSRQHRHRVRVEAYPVPGESAMGRLELVTAGGAVAAAVDGFTGGFLEFECPGCAAPSYLIARVYGEKDDPAAPRQQQIRHFAITNPVYLQPRGDTFSAVQTELELRAASDSPWQGQRCRVENAAGEVLEETRLTTAAWARQVPANARLRLLDDKGQEELHYVAMENARVQARLRYLHDGEFLKDWPDLAPGEVPPEAFHLAEMRDALQGCSLEF